VDVPLLSRADILVTGASGFLGGALVRRLRADGHRVRVLVRRLPSWIRDDTGIDVVLGDLADPDSVDRAAAGASHVYHVGAATVGTAGDFENGTVSGTRNVVDSCIRHRLRRLVYVSSLSVLDHAGREPRMAVDESAPLEPHPERRGVYTQAKLAAERLVVDAVVNRGLKAVIIRPGQIFGLGSERKTPNATLAAAGWWLAVGPGSQLLPLVYIEDVVDALILAAQRPGLDGQLFHVVDPEPVSHAEYLAQCARTLGSELHAVRVPLPLLLALAGSVEMFGRLLGRNVPITRYRTRSLRPLHTFDLTATTNVLGWRPGVGVREGLRRTFGG